MAVGAFPFPEFPVISGIELGVAAAGVKPGSTRTDLAVLEICEGASVAAVFTQNVFCAEPVKICKEHLSAEAVRYLVINSGNANACTGEAGREAALNVCNKLAELTGANAQTVLPFSTGVIGEVLPYERVNAALPECIKNKAPDNWQAVAEAIMTTDTKAKGAVCELDIDGEAVNVVGIAKGSGMIRPNMATMLGYIATDANVDQAVLQSICEFAANKSFNRITVDGDTSTNDACVLIATGKSAAPRISSSSGSEYEKLKAAVTQVFQDLAIMMVRDAEGATKLVTVEVNNALSTQDALDVAYAICHSPLVKTAMFASDPNWGRVVAAIGYSGVKGLQAERISVYLDEVQIVKDGGRAPSYSEELGQAVFSKPEFSIRVDLNMGSCTEVLWTSDLSHEYIKINAEYRT